jgi:hypothetical protein
MIKGLAESVLGRALATHGEKGTFHAVKPQIPVLDMLMRRGSVCYGVTGQSPVDRGMYKHTYLKTRTLPEERGLYHTAQFTDAELLAAVHDDAMPINQSVERDVRGRTLRVARVRLRAPASAHVRITDEQGWIFREVLHRTHEGLVVPRAVNASPASQVTRHHYYFFEENQLPAEAMQRLNAAEQEIAGRHGA